MTEEERAQLLAEWLKSPPGTDPPAGLDPEVVAAVWALRPDRAPRPRTTLDDILGSVREGPYATPEETTGEVVEFPRREPPPQLAPVEASPPSRRRPRRSRWMMPVLGGFIAAAAAAALFVPVANKLTETRPDLAASEAARMDEAPAAAPAAVTEAPPAAIPEAAPSPVPEGGAPDAILAGGAPTAPATPPATGAPATKLAEADKAGEELAPAEAAATKTPADGLLARGQEKEEEPREENAQTGLPEMQTGAPPEPKAKDTPAGGLGTSGYGTGGGGGYGTREGSGSAGPGALGDAKPQQQAPSASAPPPPAAEQGLADDEDRAEKAAAPAPAPSRGESARDRRAAEEAYAPEASKKVSQGRAATTTASRSSKGDVRTNPRTSAVPLDYDTDWYASYPDVSSTYATARMQEQNGAWAAAAAMYEGLVADARVQVAQDAAWRAARAWQNAGDDARALRVTEDGLRKSGANTPFRAQLLALRGDLLARMGRSDEATRAWQEAAELNEVR